MYSLKELQKYELDFIEGIGLNKIENIVNNDFLDKLSLDDIVEIAYFLNHITWEAFTSEKKYTFFADKLAICIDYLKRHFDCQMFDTVDLIWFWISLANMTLDLTYQYEKANDIMKWILKTSSKTHRQEKVALEYLVASQISSRQEKEAYIERLKTL